MGAREWHYVSSVRVPAGPGPAARRERALRATQPAAAPAVVLGDIDLVTALGLGGIPSIAVVPRQDPARYSRWTERWVESVEPWSHPDDLVELLLALAAELPERPVLYYQSDAELLAVVRNADRLRGRFHVPLADPVLVEDTIDKARFAQLATRTGLRVPASWSLTAGGDGRLPAPGDFPVLVKPLSRRSLALLGTTGKAVRLETPDELARLREDWARGSLDVLVQRLIPGDETRVESYHAYVDPDGAIAGEFTGVKRRTSPPEYGHSSCVVTTDAADVRAEGREVLARLGIRGVAKLDFKRDDAGVLWLLEVNLRYSLWHHLGAVGGTNLPALVHADATGVPRPAVSAVPAGLVWSHSIADLRAVRQSGLPLGTWLRTAVSSDARCGLGHGDVQPFLRGFLLPALQRHLPGRRSDAAQPG